MKRELHQQLGQFNCIAFYNTSSIPFGKRAAKNIVTTENEIIWDFVGKLKYEEMKMVFLKCKSRCVRQDGHRSQAKRYSDVYYAYFFGLIFMLPFALAGFFAYLPVLVVWDMMAILTIICNVDGHLLPKLFSIETS